MSRFDEVFGDLDLTLLQPGRRHRVFVYGTLKQGMRNHSRLQRDGVACLSTLAVTQSDFTMYSRRTGAGYCAPIVLDNREPPGRFSKTAPIEGEVYEVDNDTLLQLDLFEGHPRWYRREKRGVCYWHGEGKRRLSTSEHIWVYIYVGPLTEVTDKFVAFDYNESAVVVERYRWIAP